MNLVFLDLEYNQGKEYAHSAMPFEIIEFSYIVTDFSFNTKDEFSYLVKPEFQKEINPHVSRLTGIHTVNLQNSVSFHHCMEKFKQMCGDNFYIITWGDDDVKIIQQNCVFKRINCEFLNDIIHINAQRSYQVINDLPNVSSLQKVKLKLDVPSARGHRSYDDALDLISICKNLGISNVLSQKEAIIKNPKVKDNHIILHDERTINKIKEFLKNRPHCKQCGKFVKNEKISNIKTISQGISRLYRLTSCKSCNKVILERITCNKHKRNYPINIKTSMVTPSNKQAINNFHQKIDSYKIEK